MSVFAALQDGIRRVNRAPNVLLGVWLMTLLVSLPGALAMRMAVEQHLGASLEADSAAAGVNYDWMQEFNETGGLAAALTPTIIGFGAPLDNLSAFLDNERPLMAAAASVYLLAWLFAAGGVIDRYARDRATRAHGFFAASGVFFLRFLRLGLLSALVYGLLFGSLHPWLFEEVFGRVTQNFTSERTAFLVRAGLYLVFGLALAACNLVFDYAKVRAVVEDRRSMLGAIVAAVRFIQRNRSGVAGLYAADAALFAAVLGIYAAAAPGAGSAGASMWFGFAIGQLYVLARLWVKLVFWASETALFQGRLAHAGYVARPAPVWPESPSVEALSRM
jgi:hypothetical protein